jgi:hypothetical protein
VVGNSLEQEIINLYTEDVSSVYSINQIAGRLGKKYPYINKKVTILIKNKIFKKTIVGRSYLCSLNLENEETVYLLILNEIKRKKIAVESNHKLKQSLEYIEKISKLMNIELAIKQENSIIFVLDNDEEKEKFVNHIIKQALPGYEIEVMTKESFLIRLVKDNALREEHIILHGYEKYYEYIHAIEDELKVRYSRITP